MLYLMLGTIIFLLTFCAIGSTAPDNDKEGTLTIGLVINVILAIVLGAVYYFFIR